MGKRPTKQERRDRLEMARKLLSQRLSNGEAKRVMSRKYNMSPRSVERYLRRARTLLLQASGKTASTHRSEAYNFYASIVGNPKEKTRERILAQERIDKLFALEGPIKYAETDSQGKDIATDEARATFNRILGIIDKRRGTGLAPGGNGSNGCAHAPGAAT